MPTIISPKLRLSLLKWHRWITLALLVQLAIWLITALVMTLIARSSLTAYRAPPAASFDAVAAWPDLDLLSQAAPEGVEHIELEKAGPTPRIRMDGVDAISPVDLTRLETIQADVIAQIASDFTGESIEASSVRLKTRNSVEYQKLPTPAWRVEADQAVLFFDLKTGEYLSQTTRMRFIENLAKTIHIMDWTGKGEFRKNWVLTFFALLFLNAAVLGVLSFKKLYLKKRAIPKVMNIHQVVGLVLAVQVVFWVTSGLGVVWLLHPLRDQAEHIMVDAPAPIDWASVAVHPRDIFDPDDERGAPSGIILRMGLTEPVYQLRWPGRNPDQALWSARDGRTMTLTELDRDAIVAQTLSPDAAASITRWEVAEGPQDLDFYFYTGPYPVWKGHFSEPTSGVVSIDQVTGYVHTPRTGTEIFLERYYNVHVVNWRLRVIQYRREPALLIVIALAMLLLVTGVMVQLRRWKMTGKL